MKYLRFHFHLIPFVTCLGLLLLILGCFNTSEAVMTNNQSRYCCALGIARLIERDWPNDVSKHWIPYELGWNAWTNGCPHDSMVFFSLRSHYDDVTYIPEAPEMFLLQQAVSELTGNWSEQTLLIREILADPFIDGEIKEIICDDFARQAK